VPPPGRGSRSSDGRARRRAGSRRAARVSRVNSDRRTRRSMAISRSGAPAIQRPVRAGARRSAAMSLACRIAGPRGGHGSCAARHGLGARPSYPSCLASASRSGPARTGTPLQRHRRATSTCPAAVQRHYSGDGRSHAEPWQSRRSCQQRMVRRSRGVATQNRGIRDRRRAERPAAARRPKAATSSDTSRQRARRRSRSQDLREGEMSKCGRGRTPPFIVSAP